MSRGFSVSAIIDRPQDEVWSYMTDLVNTPQWMAAIVAMEPLGGGPAGPGARYSVHSTAGGRRVERQAEICLWEPMAGFALRSEEGGISAVYEYRCAPSNGGTRVSLHANCTARGWLWRLLHPLIVRMMRRTDGDQLERLKAVLEQA